MADELAWLACLFGLPAAVVLASFSTLPVERLRRLAVACAGALLVVSALVFFVPELANLSLPVPAECGGLCGDRLLRVDRLSSLLLPLASALWLLAVTVTPRSRLDRGGLRRTAIATMLTLGSFSTTSPILLVALWLLSVWVLLAALGAPANRAARRVAMIYLGSSSIAFAAGVPLLTLPLHPALRHLGLWLVIVAALIRKGMFPFHAWVPEIFDRGRLGPAVLFSAPQLGAYATVVLVVPRAPGAALYLVAILALVTAVYGAALALWQADARRACGYLFVSQSALVMVGLECESSLALTGSLVLWISSGLAFAGIARCVLVLEARRGRLDLRQHHGGYEQMPLVAISFLVLGLACTGFPGTLGFIGEELLVDGALRTRPILGMLVVLAGALTGLAVLRMYFSLFCGKSASGIGLPIRRREALAFASVAGILIATGIAPHPIVSSRHGASERILEQRAHLFPMEDR